MESLGDDELLSIFNKIHNVRDRTSFCQVSKQFLRVTCTGLRKLKISYPDLLKDVLTISPNLVKFTCYEPLPNAYMELLARSCPNMRHLRLFRYIISDLDFDDDGLCAVAKACSHLKKVDLDGRLYVGDAGVDYLVRSCKDLISLYLSKCARVTDESLKSIRESNSLQDLYLEGCLISDMGLKQMVNLTHLSLSKCGVNITDSGILAISQIPNIKMLNLSWLINVTDISLSPIASNCKKQETINLRVVRLLLVKVYVILLITRHWYAFICPCVLILLGKMWSQLLRLAEL